MFLLNWRICIFYCILYATVFKWFIIVNGQNILSGVYKMSSKTFICNIIFVYIMSLQIRPTLYKIYISYHIFLLYSIQ